MNLLELHKRLIVAARAQPPADHVPYAFEKRIMARLAGLGAPDPWRFWERGLARAAALCVAIMLFMGAVSLFTASGNSENLAQDVERTLFAAVDAPSADAPVETR